uniref:Chemokine (C-X-C motif) receptor 1 n=1 Tax=Callorhinchus milii TaxID=7868 RepID=A0A4W3IB77_CALMI
MESQSFTLDNEDWGDVFANYSETYSFDQGAVPCAHSVNTESVNTAMAVIYSLVCLLAMAGNVLVMIVILHNRRTMSSTDIYLLHLAIADVLFAITLPFSAADVINGWLFGDAMCKIVSVLKVRHIAGFLILLSIMLFCYSVTINRVLKTKGFQKQKAMKVIIAVVLAFLICWLPYNITVFIDTLIRSKIINETCEMRTHLDKALFATESLVFLHSCINPILYTVIGVKFRRNLIRIWVTKGINKQIPIV